MSPHEMKSSRIERDIASIKKGMAEGKLRSGYWDARVENLEKILKQRANSGTYETAGKYS
jgi:hypothetical protein